jgi:hypothetical protein
MFTFGRVPSWAINTLESNPARDKDDVYFLTSRDPRRPGDMRVLIIDLYFGGKDIGRHTSAHHSGRAV